MSFAFDNNLIFTKHLLISKAPRQNLSFFHAKAFSVFIFLIEEKTSHYSSKVMD